MADYDLLVELFARHPECVRFDPTGATDDEIAGAESQLGVTFPRSYRWWLRHTSGGYIMDDEIHGIYPDIPGSPPDTLKAGDVTHVTRVLRKSELIKPNDVLVMQDDADLYYFEGVNEPEDESPIRCCNLSTGEVIEYAPTFADFLVRRIRFRCEHGPW